MVTFPLRKVFQVLKHCWMIFFSPLLILRTFVMNPACRLVMNMWLLPRITYHRNVKLEGILIVIQCAAKEGHLRLPILDRWPPNP